MSRVQAKPTPNWCPQVNPDEPWTERCVKEKIAEDGKRHRCHKKDKHDTRACVQMQSGVEAVLMPLPGADDTGGNVQFPFGNGYLARLPKRGAADQKVEPSGQGEKVTGQFVNADGTRTTVQYTEANFDGKDYPLTGSQLGADTVSLKRIDTSGFTCVAARRLADPPMVDRCPEGFSKSITLLAASVATGANRQFLQAGLAPARALHLFTARRIIQAKGTGISGTLALELVRSSV